MNHDEMLKLYRGALEAIEQLHQQARQGGRARSLFCTLAVILDNARILDAMKAEVDAERERERNSMEAEMAPVPQDSHHGAVTSRSSTP
jgi:hypothetical protein